MGVYALKPSVIQSKEFRSYESSRVASQSTITGVLFEHMRKNSTKINGCEWKNDKDKAETVAIMDSTELKMLFSSHRGDGPTVKRAYFKKRVQNKELKTNNSPKTGLDVSGNPTTYEQGIERRIENDIYNVGEWSKRDFDGQKTLCMDVLSWRSVRMAQ